VKIAVVIRRVLIAQKRNKLAVLARPLARLRSLPAISPRGHNNRRDRLQINAKLTLVRPLIDANPRDQEIIRVQVAALQKLANIPPLGGIITSYVR
jgi:hypothetical protein